MLKRRQSLSGNTFVNNLEIGLLIVMKLVIFKHFTILFQDQRSCNFRGWGKKLLKKTKEL